ncbi:MAG: glycoside hydrolase family 9 protein [Candidatus Hodarchaeota archaeon]
MPERESKSTRKKIAAFLLIANLVIISSVLIYKSLSDNPEILVNQVGYLPGQEKTFLVKSTYQHPAGSFDLINDSGAKVIEGRPLEYLGTMWDEHYYRGNFSDINTTGQYTIEARLDTLDITSYTFRIGTNIYDSTLERGYEFFYYQRCGCRVHELVEGYVGHEPCHLDDNVFHGGEHLNATGGWHSAGDYAKHNYWGLHILGTIYSCLFAYQMNPGYYDTIDHYDVNGSLNPDGIPDVLNEAMYGLEYVEKIFLDNGSLVGSILGTLQFCPPEYDTDGIVGSEDDRWLFEGENHEYVYPWEAMWAVAGFAKMANIIASTSYFPGRDTEMMEYALNIYGNYTDGSISSVMANHELFKYTSNATYDQRASTYATNYYNWYSGIPGRDDTGGACRDAGLFIHWAMENNSGIARDMANNVSAKLLNNNLKVLSSDPGNYYNILKMEYEGEYTYINERIGLNGYYLGAAFASFMAYNVTNGTYPELLEIGLKQLNWVFGLNPFGTCMFETVGSENPSIYHHRYALIPGNRRGAVPGAIINGICKRDGKPFINEVSATVSAFQDKMPSSSSNEPWLPHNVEFMYMIGAMYKFIL